MRVARRILPFAAAWLLLAAGPGRGEDAPVAGDERVLSFHSEITVLPDASLVVRETIRVRAAGRTINHGIYRDFPTRFRNSEGIWFDVPFGLIEVRRDGKPEPWRTTEGEHGVRAYFGDAEQRLEPGEHTYTIAYRTDRQLGFFADHDELFWIVTGHEWTLPIDEVEARVLLPRGIPAASLEVRTGTRESLGREATASWDAEGGALFRTTRPFRPGEGLTVILRWPKGFVPEPAAPRRWWWYFLGSNRSVLAGLAGLLLVLTYFVLAGRHAARFPDRGAVAKCGDPAGRTPAELRVLRTGRCDGRAFVATVVRMAVKGYLVIEERGGAYSLSLGRADGVELAPEEALAAGDLDLERIGRVGIDRANDGRIGGAINDLKNILRISTERTHLLRNRDYLLPGLALSVVVLVSTLTFEPGLRLFIGGLISVLLFFWTIGVSLLAYQLVCRWKDVLLRRGHPRHALFHAVSMTVFAVPVALAELAGLALVTWLGSPSYSAVLLALAFMNVRFHYVLQAPAWGSQGLLDEIDGFAASLAADGAAGTGPFGRERTPELYEELLPYAIALDREEAWSRQCADALSRPGAAGRTYWPAWYRAESPDGGPAPARFPGLVGEGLCQAIAAAAAAPGFRERPGGGAHGR